MLPIFSYSDIRRVLFIWFKWVKRMFVYQIASASDTLLLDWITSDWPLNSDCRGHGDLEHTKSNSKLFSASGCIYATMYTCIYGWIHVVIIIKLGFMLSLKLRVAISNYFIVKEIMKRFFLINDKYNTPRILHLPLQCHLEGLRALLPTLYLLRRNYEEIFHPTVDGHGIFSYIAGHVQG